MWNTGQATSAMSCGDGPSLIGRQLAGRRNSCNAWLKRLRTIQCFLPHLISSQLSSSVSFTAFPGRNTCGQQHSYTLTPQLLWGGPVQPKFPLLDGKIWSESLMSLNSSVSKLEENFKYLEGNLTAMQKRTLTLGIAKDTHLAQARLPDSLGWSWSHSTPVDPPPDPLRHSIHSSLDPHDLLRQPHCYFNSHFCIFNTNLFFLNWNIIDLQYCVSFRCTAKWFFLFFSIIGYYNILNIVACAMAVNPCCLSTLYMYILVPCS